jgi:hypothetical protein
MTTLSLRRLWTLYKRTALRREGPLKRDPEQALVQNAFYCGARGVLQVLAYLLEHGDYEELHRTIERQGRQIRAIRAERRRPQARARRH